MPAFLLSLGPTLLKNWKLALGGVLVAVLGIMLLIARGNANHWHKFYDNERVERIQVADALKVSDASIASLESMLKAKNAESEGRAREFAQAQSDWASQRATLVAQYHASDDVRKRLAAAITAKPDGTCKVPSAVIDGLEGL